MVPARSSTEGERHAWCAAGASAKSTRARGLDYAHAGRALHSCRDRHRRAGLAARAHGRVGSHDEGEVTRAANGGVEHVHEPVVSPRGPLARAPAADSATMSPVLVGLRAPEAHRLPASVTA